MGGISELEVTPGGCTMGRHKHSRRETTRRASNFSCYQGNDHGVAGGESRE